MKLAAILGAALITAVLALILKGQSGEMALAVSAAGGCFIFLLMLSGVSDSFAQITEYISKLGVNAGCFKVVLKALGVCYVTGFTADLCRDYGQSSLAGRVELAGKLCILVISLPLMKQVMDIAVDYIG